MQLKYAVVELAKLSIKAPAQFMAYILHNNTQHNDTWHTISIPALSTMTLSILGLTVILRIHSA